MKFKKPPEVKVVPRLGDELRKKDRRDFIARQAEEREENYRRNLGRAKKVPEERGAARNHIREAVRIWFNWTEGHYHPCGNGLIFLLDLVRLEFFKIVKDKCICGHQEDNALEPFDPEFGAQGNREARYPGEKEAVDAWRKGEGPMCQSASKKDPLSACKRDPLIEQCDGMTGAPFALVAA